jgi:hypothetical protein
VRSCHVAFETGLTFARIFLVRGCVTKKRAGEGQQTERVPQISVLPAAQVSFFLVSPARVISACIHSRGVAHNSTHESSDRSSVANTS